MIDLINENGFTKEDIDKLLGKLEADWELSELTPWDLELIEDALIYYKDKNYIG